MKDRVSCRLGLTAADLANELKIAYLPEECRQINNPDQKDACIQTYSESQKCWQFDIGQQRNSCLKDMLNITDISAQKDNCQNNADCNANLKNNVYTLAKFKIYDLEERAEEMLDKNLITKDQAATIITQLEQDKILFNQAINKNGRITALNAAKTHWIAFINEVRK